MEQIENIPTLRYEKDYCIQECTFFVFSINKVVVSKQVIYERFHKLSTIVNSLEAKTTSLGKAIFQLYCIAEIFKRKPLPYARE